ncbi:MAG: NEW3 domain-containing protein [Firmicutes bacterium]|nr:NEW3 domain-containing protein [Bacillota bacterium]
MVRVGRLFASLALAVLLLLTLLPAAPAAAAITLSSKYPGLTVKPGQRLTVPLQVTSSGTGGVVDLEVAEVPRGWEQPVFKGENFNVTQVYVHAGGSETVNLEVRVPENVKPGRYRMLVRAEGPQGVSTLPITLTVAQPRPAAARLTTQYPALQGAAGATFEFRVDLHNDGDTKETFSLTAKAPEGWEVIFHPGYDTKRIATIPVEGGSSETLNVEVKTPNDVPAGTYTVDIAAQAGEMVATLQLQVGILGRAELEITTPSGRLSLDAVAGKETTFQVQVQNKGTAPLASVSLSATAPPNWTVTFAEQELKDLGPGEVRDVQVTLKPDAKAIAGDYVVTLRANSSGLSDSAELRVTVKTSTAWGLVGAAVVIAALGGVGWLFRTYGRR